MSRTIEYRVGPDDDGARLDRWFKRHRPDVTHALLSRWTRQGLVRVNGAKTETGARLELGQIILVPPSDASQQVPKVFQKPKGEPLSDAEIDDALSMVLYRDAQALVLNKPPGLATQGGTRTDQHVDRLLDALTFGEPMRPKLVHRLDKDTSGVLLLGRTTKATEAFAATFRGRTARKLYWALVVGIPKQDEGEIDLPLAKGSGAGNLEKMIVDQEEGQTARSRYRVIERIGQRAAWLELEPLTGRTHQLRVHCAQGLGCPIVGDGKYGGEKNGAPDPFLTGGISRKLHLHARRLVLPHTLTGVLDITAPLPKHMADSWSLLGLDAGEDAAFDPLLSAVEATPGSERKPRKSRAGEGRSAPDQPKLHHTQLWSKTRMFKPKARRGKGRSR
jgi:23S rRNA pseudouridine955/2504/2580 synthase